MLRRLGIGCLLISAALAFAPAAYAGPVYQTNPDITDQRGDFPSDPDGAIKAARELLAEGKMPDAIKQLQRYVAAHPTDWSVKRFLGDLYFRSGDIDRARFTYAEILAQAPKDKETHNRLGTVLAVENHIDDAIAEFNAALPGTDSVDDLVALHERKGDILSYEHEMQKLAVDNPNDADIQAELGQVYNALRQPYLASVYFRRALDSDHANLTAHNGLGIALMNMNDWAGAEIEFKACLGIDHTTYQCQDNLGAAYLEQQKYGLAKTALDVAYHLAPEHAETFVNYGYLADAQGDWHKAVSYYAQAIALYPYLREAYIDLGIAYEAHNLNGLAQAALVKGLASVHDDGRIHYLLGQAYESQGDARDAMVQFKAAAEGSDPDAARFAQARVAEISGASHPEK